MVCLTIWMCHIFTNVTDFSCRLHPRCGQQQHISKEVDLHEEKVLITCAVVLGVLLAVYLGFAFYFSSHYLFNTKINSVKYAGKTAKEALEKIQP